MTINELFSIYDMSVEINNALAMDFAGDMKKLNDEDFVDAWKMVGNNYGTDVGIVNSLLIHRHIQDRFVQIFTKPNE